ncbi:MAG: ATP-binding cassette domain-containing protein [Comamonadaceae bacterium]|nr:MAG: ATP-binding cassette domain-containing protein [Comamonadaceae bacterium]
MNTPTTPLPHALLPDHPQPPGTVLSATGLAFSFDAGGALFSGLTVDLPAGVTLVRGGDGSGKTTLMRVLAGALPATAGDVQIGGSSLKADPAAYRRHVFWTEPRSEAFEQFTPSEYFETVRSRYAGFDSRVLDEMTDALGLGPHMAKQLFMLSTGSKRKVWLAAAFASQAWVTFIDEPFAALDTPSIRAVMQGFQAVDASAQRAFVIADYEAPDGLPLAGIIDLGER